MGTNYYFHEKPDCPHCGRSYEPRHIGKSSAGWCFTMRVHPEDMINDFEDWKREFAKPGTFIKNEYGETVSVEQMIETITNRSMASKVKNQSWYAMNSAEPGPNNLARHKIDRFCIGHGEGTWDYLVGEFS